MSAGEQQDGEMIGQDLMLHIGNLGSARIAFANNQGKVYCWIVRDVIEIIGAVIGAGDAGALQDDAGKSRSYLNENRAGARAAGKSGRDLCALANADSPNDIVMRGEKVPDRRRPGSVARFNEHDDDVRAFKGLCHVAHARIPER